MSWEQGDGEEWKEGGREGGGEGELGLIPSMDTNRLTLFSILQGCVKYCLGTCFPLHSWTLDPSDRLI